MDSFQFQILLSLFSKKNDVMLYSGTENKSKKRRMSWMDLRPSLP